MSDFFKSKFNRRGVLKSSMAMMGGGLLSRYGLEKAAAQTEPAVKNVNLNSSPSTLKITDMRYAIIVKPGPSPAPSFASTPTRASTGWARCATLAATSTRWCSRTASSAKTR